MLNYEEFKTAVKAAIECDAKTMFPGAVITVSEDIEFHPLLEEKLEGKILLRQCYAYYTETESFKTCMEGIYASIQSGLKTGNKAIVDFLSDFERCKDRIMLHAVNFENRKERLIDAVYRREGEFAFYYIVDLDEENAARISSKMLETWGITEEQLHDIAMENTHTCSPAVFAPMTMLLMNMMTDCFEDILNEEKKKVSGNKYADLFVPEAEGISERLFVLTTTGEQFGAAALFYPGIREKIAELLCSSYYIIPSSVHEVLIVPANGIHEPEVLRELLHTVNKAQVPKEERLSSSIYIYDFDAEEFRGEC